MDTAIDSHDKDRGFFRRVEGLCPWPMGAFSSLTWQGFNATTEGHSGGDTRYADLEMSKEYIADESEVTLQTESGLDLETELSGESVNHTHLVRVRFSGNAAHDLIVAWSRLEHKCKGIWPVYPEWTGEAQDEEGIYAVPITFGTSFTVGLLATDLDPALPWYCSRIDDRLYFGNGTDLNYRYIPATETFSELTPSGDGAHEDRAQVKFPPCKQFVMGGNREIYATGNVTHPLRVWASDKPGDQYPLFEGIRSANDSYTDVLLPGATKINALSTWNNYISAHTDAGVMNCFGHNNTTDGYKTESRPSATAAGACNPDCVADAEGFGSYYLGTDNQFYKDESTRGGPFNKRDQRRIDSPVSQFDKWNYQMGTYTGSEQRRVIYDRHRGLVYIIADTSDGFTGIWCYNESIRGIAGPILQNNFDAATSFQLKPTGYTTIAAIDDISRLSFCTGPDEGTRLIAPASSSHGWTDTAPALGSSSQAQVYAVRQKEAPTLTGGEPEALFALRAKGDLLRRVFGHNESLTGASPHDSDLEWLYDGTAAIPASWAILDTGFQDFGNDTVEKTLREIRVSLDRGPAVSVNAVAMNDLGHQRTIYGDFAALDGGQKTLRLMLKGRRFRVVVALGYASYDWPITVHGMELRYLASRVRAR